MTLCACMKSRAHAICNIKSRSDPALRPSQSRCRHFAFTQVLPERDSLEGLSHLVVRWPRELGMPSQLGLLARDSGRSVPTTLCQANFVKKQCCGSWVMLMHHERIRGKLNVRTSTAKNHSYPHDGILNLLFV